MQGRVWEEKSKQLLKNLIDKRIRSIIGVSLQAVEDNVPNDNTYATIRFLIMKVCNDISRKLAEDIDKGFTVKRNAFHYDIPYKGTN